jgi:hypothetical protein
MEEKIRNEKKKEREHRKYEASSKVDCRWEDKSQEMLRQRTMFT